jgi:hypothetical protein
MATEVELKIESRVLALFMAAGIGGDFPVSSGEQTVLISS